LQNTFDYQIPSGQKRTRAVIAHIKYFRVSIDGFLDDTLALNDFGNTLNAIAPGLTSLKLVVTERLEGRYE
jgi:hypothetical protein